jgi:hypothetical protein
LLATSRGREHRQIAAESRADSKPICRAQARSHRLGKGRLQEPVSALVPERGAFVSTGFGDTYFA